MRPGTIVRKTCLGHDLIVARGADSGKVIVSDAHCPHQGADLGVGGCVRGDRIRCPFHHWEFGLDGYASHIPDVNRVPVIRLGTWPVCERYGMIWTYVDAAEPRCEPKYPFENLADLDDGTQVWRGEHHADDVGMHLIEFAENSVDFQHFSPLHGRMLIPWTRVPLPFLTVKHEARWQPDPDRSHIAYFRDDPTLLAFGKPVPRSAAKATITFFGPGGAIWFRFSIPELGNITLFQTHTPVEPLRQQIYFRWYAEPKIPRPVVSYVVGSWVSNWKADVDIWENKVYRPKPMLCRADGPVHEMRRWYQQFYPAS